MCSFHQDLLFIEPIHPTAVLFPRLRGRYQLMPRLVFMGGSTMSLYEGNFGNDASLAIHVRHLRDTESL